MAGKVSNAARVENPTAEVALAQEPAKNQPEERLGRRGSDAPLNVGELVEVSGEFGETLVGLVARCWLAEPGCWDVHVRLAG